MILLSTEFSPLMDGIEIELVTEGLRMVSGILFVDDISLVSPDIQQLKRC